MRFFRGAVVSRLVGIAFFLDWLAMELLLFLASPDKELRAEEQRVAMGLLLFSRSQPDFPWTPHNHWELVEYRRMIDINNITHGS